MRKYQLAFISIIIPLITCNFLNAQVQVEAKVVDSITHEPLPYCNVVIKNSNEGIITNADGKFVLSVESLSDSLLVSYIGYAKKTIAIKDVAKDDKIYLHPQSIILQEITVTTERDFFYDLVSKCRKNLQKSKSKHIAKMYYGLNTTRDGVPVEVLECYYNCDLKGTKIDNFLLKNGKVGLKNKDGLIFLSFNLSQLVSTIDLTSKTDFYPYLPLHFNKSQLKKRYRLSGISIDNYYKIYFTPIENNNRYFSGTAWIEKSTNSLEKLELIIENTNAHPLTPRKKTNNFSLHLTYYFVTKEEDILLSHVDFKYTFDFEYLIQGDVDVKSASTFVNTSGLVYCYDYDQPFILPYFDYNKNMDEYQKLAVFPYNSLFWKNSKLLLSEEQTAMLQSMNRDDLIFSSDSETYGNHFMKNVTSAESYLLIGRSEHIFWHPHERINVEERKVLSDDSLALYMRFAPHDLYKLNSQIFLDVNTINEVNYCTSYSVFNTANSYSRMPTDTLAQIFTNIYFDIFEIERRKMQEKLDANTYTLKQIDEIYYATLDKIDEIITNYFEDVVFGTNINELKIWNQYVNEKLGIDNFLLFQKNKNP